MAHEALNNYPEPEEPNEPKFSTTWEPPFPKATKAVVRFVAKKVRRAKKPLADPVVDAIKFVTGYEKEFTGNQFLGIVDRSYPRTSVLGSPLEAADRHVTKRKYARQQRILANLGASYQNAGNEHTKDEALSKAITIFLTQQRPDQIRKR